MDSAHQRARSPPASPYSSLSESRRKPFYSSNFREAEHSPHWQPAILSVPLLSRTPSHLCYTPSLSPPAFPPEAPDSGYWEVSSNRIEIALNIRGLGEDKQTWVRSVLRGLELDLPCCPSISRGQAARLWAQDHDPRQLEVMSPVQLASLC